MMDADKSDYRELVIALQHGVRTGELSRIKGECA